MSVQQIPNPINYQLLMLDSVRAGSTKRLKLSTTVTINLFIHKLQRIINRFSHVIFD